MLGGFQLRVAGCHLYYFWVESVHENESFVEERQTEGDGRQIPDSIF